MRQEICLCPDSWPYITWNPSPRVSAVQINIETGYFTALLLKVLTIDHQNYFIVAARNMEDSVQNAGN